MKSIQTLLLTSMLVTMSVTAHSQLRAPSEDRLTTGIHGQSRHGDADTVTSTLASTGSGGPPVTQAKINYNEDQQFLAACVRAQPITPQRAKSLVIMDIDTPNVIPVYANYLPPYPTNAESGVMGTDSDGDCVRDDVELLIADLFPDLEDTTRRNALLEYARLALLFLNPRLSTPTTFVVNGNLGVAHSCVIKAIGNAAVAEDAIFSIHKQVYNTDQRVNAWLSRQKILADQTTRDLPQERC